MTSQFSSSNPFRRKAVVVPEAPNVNEKTAAISSNSIQAPQTDFTREIIKPVKKVRVQSPHPPSSPEALSISQRSPIPISIGTLDDVSQIDPFETSEHESIGQNPKPKSSSNAPPNPFAKTLETLQPTEALSSNISTNTSHTHGPGRASLDVDAFKRLLMTGHSGRTTSSGTPPHSSYQSTVPDGTSTDTSSISRQSIFESIQEALVESPRTSHELSEQENERYNTVQDFSTGRKKPLPPSSRHGKLIKLELRDDPVQIRDPSRPSSSSSKASQQFSYRSPSPMTRSQTDLNKPLPAAPNHPSNELSHEDQESIFDKEAAGKVPEPPSPTSSISRKLPPAPPITRRHSQLVSNSRNRTDSGRLSPRLEEEVLSPTSLDSGRERSSSNSSIAPAPPPSRQARSLRSPAHAPPISSPSAGSIDSLVTSPKIAPPPPPSRSLSTRKPSQPASIKSMEFQKESQKDPPRRLAAPPPPPPRHRGSSHDNTDNAMLSPATVSTGDSLGKRNSSSRRTSDTSEPPDNANPESFTPNGPDILADLSALQREVEAAMAQQRKVS